MRMGSYANALFVILAAILLLQVAEVVSEKNKETYPLTQEESQRERYTASWAVEIAEGGDKTADKMASRYGFRNRGRVGGLHNVYHFELQGLEQTRMPKDFPYTAKSQALLSEPCVGFAEQQVMRPMVRKSYTVAQDPLFQSQWYLLNSGQYGNDFRGSDLNVERAWLQGVTGCNVTVNVVDDGLDFLHPDLWDNFVPQVSYNFIDEDSDPSTSNPWHGTSCGGIIAAAKDGQTCGLGVAYNANLGGIALLGANSDLNEERSLTYENNVVDIYSNSWGPSDYGSAVEGPERLTRMALRSAVKEGRGGKGSIFVWANGNGGDFDDCAADGYASSIYTISVGAIGVTGAPSSFDEQCSAKMVVTYVTNFDGHSAVSTTALGGECTNSFGGTSAATPMASGIIALALEANPELTWRDVQYLIAYTSNPDLTDTSNYAVTINGGGLQVSRDFGFGVMDAEAMVTRARHWINVPPQLKHSRTPATDSGEAIFNSPYTTAIQYSGSIQYLEHVVVHMTVETDSVHGYGSRGDIRIELTSPFGTLSTLLGHRDGDFGIGGYYEWPFMSVMFWGEDPAGEWSLNVISRNSETEIDVSDVEFQFFGTSAVPQSVASIPNKCDSDCARGCAAEGSRFCDACVNLRNAYTLECIDQCPPGYTERNGYCFNPAEPEEQCNSPLKVKEEGSCVESGYVGCCVDGDCKVSAPNFPVSCYCDASCYLFGDCCDDIDLINCHEENSTNIAGSTRMPYIALGETEGVQTDAVPNVDDGLSLPIDVAFPMGSRIHSTIYIGTNGYFTLDQQFNDYQSVVFNEHTNMSLVAPFFTDIDISSYSGAGNIFYEAHTADTSQTLLSSIDSVINQNMETEFHGEWLLVAEWNNVQKYGSPNTTNSFQGILTTNFVKSFAVFTYMCGDLSFSGGATIGFSTKDGLYANHVASVRGNAQAISCLNSPDSPWVNVVYELTLTENECEVNNGGCEYTCTDTVTSFECSCPDRYSLDQDGLTCSDINECTADSHECDQFCVNTEGSYNCTCRDDYVLDSNGRTCSISCGGRLTEMSGSFHTPGWPGSYPFLDFRCVWVIDIDNQTDTLINIVFDEKYGIHGRNPCPTDYVEVIDGVGEGEPSLGKFCFHHTPEPILTSSDKATVVFQASSFRHLPSRVGVSISYTAIPNVNECEVGNGGCAQNCMDTLNSYTCSCDDGYLLDDNGKGCIDINECSSASHGCDQLCVNSEGSYSCACRDGYALDSNGMTCSLSCGGILTGTSGSFQTPGWPANYPQLDFSCEWTMQNVSAGKVIRFEVDRSVYGINGRPPCSNDHIEFFDGIDSNAVSLGRFCKLAVPDPITVTTGAARVVFEGTVNSRRPPSRKGVRVNYEILDS